MKRIPLTQGYTALVDDEDYEWLSRFSWHVQLMQRGTKYAAARTSTISQDGVRGKSIYMHRAIMKAKHGEQVDHADGDLLNNQKYNLRLCNNAQNQANQKSHTGFYKGLKLRKNGSWSVRIKANGIETNLGTYSDPVKAAQVYDCAAVYLYGEFASINFPEHKEDYLKQTKDLEQQGEPTNA